jgi:hypothetical protein
MIESNETLPYQRLYRDSTGFPNYKLDANNDIFIQTPFLPILSTDSSNINIPTYHFHYFHGFEISSQQRGYPSHPENEYTRHFISLVSKKKVSVNGKLCNGRIKFAFTNSSWGVNDRKSVTDIYIVDYKDGSPTEVKQLKDVDLITERTPIRHN